MRHFALVVPALLVLLACGDDPASTGTGGSTSQGGSSTSSGAGGDGAGAGTGAGGSGQGGAAEGGSATGGSGPTGTPTVVGVGYGGGGMRSLDLGLTWSDLIEDDPNGGDDQNLLRATVYAQGLFVAAGWRIHSSPDGVTWTEHTVNGQQWCGGLDYGNGRFVCAGGCGQSLHSSDGQSWQMGANATPNECRHVRSVAFGNGVFVAAGDGGFVTTTTDGDSWTALVDLPISRVRFRDGAFIGEGQSGEHMTSTNGVDWANAPGAPITADFGHGYFFEGQWKGRVNRSLDGATWDQVYDAGGNHLQAFAFGYTD